jgi:N-acetylmuramoyl-L-alanine amidase
MKIKYINLLLIIIGILLLNITKVEALLPLSGKTIVIDPGHGA